jgi:hypothetical protein
MRQLILLSLVLVGLSGCAATDSPAEFSGSGGNGTPGTPGPTPATPAAPMSAVGTMATVVIKNVTVGQITRIATGFGTPAIGSADLVIQCVITAEDAVQCDAIPGVPL